MRRICPHSLFLSVLAVLTIFGAIPTQARAETLDDASIRAIYANLAENIKDKSKTLQNMKERLADDYVMKLQQSTIVNGSPPHRTQLSLNREEAIANVAKGYETMTIGNDKSDVHDIKYSQDKKTAYIRVTSVMVGTLSIPGLANVKFQLPKMNFKNEEACEEAATLVNGTIKIAQSSCNGKIVIGQ